jgi:glycosyltransferase involved in cell wall biosynthesis
MSLFWKENPIFLDTALDSLHKQTLPANEIILVVEGILPDSLLQIVNKWKDIFTSDVLKLIDAENAHGLPACLNLGLLLAKGNIIIRFDTDDWCYPNRIEEQVKFFQYNQDISIISASMEEYDDELKNRIAYRKVPQTHNEIYKYAKWRNPFNHPSVAYKKDVAIKLGGYPLVGANEDYAFFCNFLVHGYKAANLKNALVKARTGIGLAKRRSGKKYIKGEIECLKYIYSIKFYSLPLFYLHLALKRIIRNLPIFMVKRIYHFFLRDKSFY